jgi:hypothetical protein
MALKNTYQARKRFTKTPVKSTGMWYQEGDVVVPSNQITMKGPQGQPNYFNSPILGVGMQSGQQQVMQPGREYLFPNDQSVFETKMQNGAINLTKDIRALNTNPQKNNFNSALTTADMVTDVMQMGHFIPHPIGQAVGYVGDVLGAGVDLTQSSINASEGDYQGAAINLGLGLLPGAVGKRGYKRANSLISGKGSGYYRPLQALPHLKNNPVIKQGLMFNKATLGANALEIGSNVNFNNNRSNDFGGYQDNTRVAPVVRPNWYNSEQWDKAIKSQMQNGGLLPRPSVGVDPEMMFRNKYNTQLKSKEQKQFDSWADKESKRQGRDILMDMGAYDVTGFWKSGDYKRMDSDNHGSDKWKKPNHPTFSNQSKYHGTDGWYGGNWTDKAGYQPSKQTLETYGPDYYNEMFQSEPGRSEYLDLSRYNSGQNKPTPFIYQIGGEKPTEQNPERMQQVNIQAPQRSWFDRNIERPLRKWGRSYAQRISDQTGGAEWYKQPNSVASAFFSTGPGFALEAPQLTGTYAASGKVQLPSEAMDIQNPYGAFAVDMLLDPSGALTTGSRTLRGIGNFALGKLDRQIAKQINKNPRLALSLQNATSSVDDAGKLGNYQKILDQGLDIHDVRLKYHNNMLLDFDESSMLNKFGKGNKSNYEKALVEDISGKMHTDDIAPKINKNLSGKEIMDGLLGKEQVKVTVPNKNITPIENNSNIVIKDFIDEEQNIIVPKKIEIPSFRSDPYQRTSTSRAADKWLEDWFTNSETKQKFIEYGGTEKEWTGILNSLENPIKSNYKWGKNQPGGVYMKLFDQASIPLDATVDIGVHEGIHKAKLLLQKENPILHRLWNDLTDAVRLTPSEAYPEIFRFRQKLGLKPGQTIDLKTMEDNLHLISDGYSMNYKIKDKNKLLEIINKAPALIPAAMGVGASQLQEKKYGGLQQSYKKTKRFK